MEAYRIKTFKILLIFFVFCFVSCGDNSFKALNTDEKINFSYNPKNKSLSGFNEPFLLFFYASTCGYCTEEAKYLKQYENDFKMIGVIGDKPKKEDAKKYTHNLNIPIVYEYAGVEFLSSAVGGVVGVPVIVFFDKNGNMIKRYNGLISAKTLELQIKSLKN